MLQCVKTIEKIEKILTSNIFMSVEYQVYAGEQDLPTVMNLVDNELSEPYSIFTYRYLINRWPQLCYIATLNGNPVGTVVCKIDENKGGLKRGYIAMIVVLQHVRGRGIATGLVNRCVVAMRGEGCHEVALEAEVTNSPALTLYGKLGFVKAKRLHRHYLNGTDAFRLKLRFPQPPEDLAEELEDLNLNSQTPE